MDVDVILVIKDLIRIVGIGIFRGKIGEIILEKLVYFFVLKDGKFYVINKEIEENCNKCVNRENCKELVDICIFVKMGEYIFGILGIVVFNEE